MASTAAAHRVQKFPLLSLGFRPFYLLASGYAVIAMILWILLMTGGIVAPTGYAPTILHAHEFLFGFAPAVLAGFLLTAAQSWSGQPTPSGIRLASLAALWLLGRVTMPAGPSFIATISDGLFLPVLAVAAAWPIMRSRRWKHLRVVALVLLLALANLAFHLEQSSFGAISPEAVFLLGLGVWVMLITVIGGRIIPAFTDNACGPPRARRVPWLDTFVFLITAGAFVMMACGAEQASGPVLALASLLHLTRLVLWRPLRGLRDPLLWSLPLGYAWVPVGLGLLAAAAEGIVSVSAGIHALTAGAMGGLMLAVMTRSSKGHTGRPLRGSRSDAAIYLAGFVAAAARVCASLASDGTVLLDVAGAAWIVAFFMFTLGYAPMLMRPRIDEAARSGS